MATAAAPAVLSARAALNTAPRSDDHDGATLDRAAFTKTVVLKALRIKPQQCKTFMTTFRPVLLNIKRYRNIVDDAAPPADDGGGGGGGEAGGPTPGNKAAKKMQHKRLLLCPSITCLGDLDPALRATVEASGALLVDHELTLGFDYWSAEQLLRAALPLAMTEITSSFEAVGHIAHMNLRDEQLPYKRIIGEIILAKNKSITTVVNKLSSIDTTFRFFKMENIAGVDGFKTSVKESGCTFHLEFDKVYWNSRLHMEHDRIIRLMTKTDVVLDMMAGIGPFAVPLGKNGNLVYANDLNPNSYKWLVENAKTNKVAGTVRSFNMDGREFTRMINTQVDQAMTLSKTTHPDFTHVVMNLPASAQEFLDVFRGLYATRAPGNRPAKLPTIHCYCFSKADDVETDALAMCSEFLNYKLVKGPTCTARQVRDVAPKKIMMCVSFQLPHEVAYEDMGAGQTSTACGGTAGDGDGAAAEQAAKRLKVDA